MSYMNNLWHASPESEICFDQNISYADRLRISEKQAMLFSHLVLMQMGDH